MYMAKIVAIGSFAKLRTMIISAWYERDLNLLVENSLGS